MLPKANRSVFLSCLVAFLEADAATLPSNTKSIVIPNAASSDAGIPLDSFVSFSFELSAWPDFAGKSCIVFTVCSGVLKYGILRQPVASERLHKQPHEQLGQAAGLNANRSRGRQHSVIYP